MRGPELPRHDAVVRVEKIGQAWRARASLFFAGVPRPRLFATIQWIISCLLHSRASFT
jgi:hypothetical protein